MVRLYGALTKTQTNNYRGYLNHDHNHAGDVDDFDDDATDDLADNHDGNDDISGDDDDDNNDDAGYYH